MNEILVFAVYLAAIFAVMAIGCVIAFFLERSPRLTAWLFRLVYGKKRRPVLPCDYHCRYYGTEFDGDHYITICRKHGTDIDTARTLCKITNTLGVLNHEH